MSKFALALGWRPRAINLEKEGHSHPLITSPVWLRWLEVCTWSLIRPIALAIASYI
jgi:hypothetical protein